METWPEKTPSELLDYEIDFAARLGTDTISSVAWTVPSGLTNEDETNTTTIAAIWLSGGTSGQNYRVRALVTSAGGRVFDVTVILPIKSA